MRSSDWSSDVCSSDLQFVEGAELIEHEQGAQGARTGERHEAVDGKVHPEGQQRPVHRQIDIVRGDEQERYRLLLVGEPDADRKGFTLGWQEAESLSLGVEASADGLSQASRLSTR